MYFTKHNNDDQYQEILGNEGKTWYILQNSPMFERFATLLKMRESIAPFVTKGQG